MKTRVIFDLTKSEVSTICQVWAPQNFNRETSLVYSGQIPILGFLLVSGQLTWQVQPKEQTLRINPPALVGLIDLLNCLPSPATLTALAQSQISMVNKLELQSQLENNSEIGQQLKKIFQHRANISLNRKV